MYGAKDCVDRGSDMLQIEEESADTKMDIGPITLQHMDSHYRTNQGCVDRGDVLQIKEESADTKMDIGPTTLQYPDSYYRTHQGCVDRGDMLQIKEESADTKVDIAPITLQPMDSHYGTNQGCEDRGDMLQIKEESADTKMDIGPTTLQHINSHYRTVQRRTNAVRPESATDNSNVDTFLSSAVKQSSNEVKFKRLDWKPNISTKSLAAAGIRIVVEGRRLVIVPAVLQHRTNQQNVSGVVKTKKTIGNDPVNVSVVKTKNTIFNDPVNISVVKTENTIDSDTELCSGVEEETFGECEDADIEIYICDYCLLTFCSKATIINHMTEHITRLPRCNICDKSFKHKRYLKIHKSSMHTPLMKECNECGKFVVPSNLKKHMLSAHSVKKWQCRICLKIMESNLDLQCHLNNVHGQKQSTDSSLVNTCQYCQNIYVDQMDLIAHIKRVHGPPFLGCPNCKVSYNNEDHLRRHITSVHLNLAGAEPNLYICDYCQKSFIKKFDIIDHITSVHASASYKCNLCDKSFMCEKYLQTHTRSTHTDKELKCMICGEKVVSKQKLLDHLNNVHRQESIDSPFLNRCGGFQKIYTGRKNLTPRIRNTDGRSYHRCIECIASFMSAAGLQIHMKVVHFKEKHQENSQQSMERSASKHPPVGTVNPVAGANTQQKANKEMKLCSVVLHRMDFQLPAVQKDTLLD